MNVLITGSEGFIGKNLKIFLSQKKINIFTFDREDSEQKLHENILKCDVICHLAGENRPKNRKLFYINNTLLTDKICNFLINKKKRKKIIFTSTTKINDNSLYAKSKKQCEKILLNYKRLTKANISILRFPNVFGKWSRPNYNSVVATFCYNISRKKSVKVFNKTEKINLLYIDDAIEQIYETILTSKKYNYPNILKVNKIKVSSIAKKLIYFNDILKRNHLNDFTNTLDENLFSTFISFLPKRSFFFKNKSHYDQRGNFIEFSKNQKFGQFSVFTIKKKKERGGHFHHSKVEKFLIIKGSAKLIYRNIKDNSKIVKNIKSSDTIIFYSIPGWVHTIKNIGNDEIVGIVWANEIFNKQKTDTYYLNEE